MKKSRSYQVKEIELVYKSPIDILERPTIDRSSTAYSIFLKAWNPSRIEFIEDCKVMLLNKGNKVLGIYHLSSGATDAALIDVKLIMMAALKANATGLLIAHNHPSGRVIPSEQDKKITAKVKRACESLTINFLDHLILTRQTYLSFADEGLI